MHIGDERAPAAYGRIPEPEDIFGSLQVNPDGSLAEGTGLFQESGSYRVLTREGCLGLSAVLRERLVGRLRGMEEMEEEEGQAEKARTVGDAAA